MKARLVLVTALLAVVVVLTCSAATAATPTRAVFFVADGMRPDLMQKFSSQGAMPTYANLMNIGVKGQNGLVQAFPPNT